MIIYTVREINNVIPSSSCPNIIDRPLGVVSLCATQKDGRRCTAPSGEPYGVRVYYGDYDKGHRWAYTDLKPGQSIECQKVNFDGCDPVPNVSKSCYSLVVVQ